jgi:hypothetical protein
MVIAMLAIGSLAVIAFIIVEWRVAKLPMMPGTSSSLLYRVNVLRLTPRTRSGHLPQPRRLRHAGPKLPLRPRLSGLPLLYPPVPPECAPALCSALRAHAHHHGRPAEPGVGLLWLIYFTLQTLWRGAVVWLWDMDTVSPAPSLFRCCEIVKVANR